jgi:hypothetical protein
VNKELKAKWVAALRSDKYKQGRRSLHNTSGEFCCLGVLCEVSKLGKWVPNISKSSLNYWFVTETETHQATLPTVLITNVGRAYVALLMKMNDINEDSFTKIADWIEKRL